MRILWIFSNLGAERACTRLLLLDHVFLDARYTNDFAPAVNNRSDAWISVWNEPFMWDGSDNVTPAVWLAEMIALVDIIRNAGTENILVVPCGLMGQSKCTPVRQPGMCLIQVKTSRFCWAKLPPMQF